MGVGNHLRSILRLLRGDERGQDLAEYCLITALIALIGLAIFIHVSGGVSAIWGTANTALVSGNSAAPASGAAAAAATQPANGPPAR
ncbi:MAG: hypothetical protein LAP87_29200 [Acidobacteriia bacterium]|nr:hypothetical protein [Terriglobia bacterium]